MLEALTRALCHHPEAQRSWRQAQMRAAEIGLAKGAYLPQFSSTLDYARTEQDYQRSLGTEFSATTRGYSIRMNWLLLDMGRRGARLEQARALLDAANAGHDRALQDAMLDFLQAYLDSARMHAGWRASREAERLAVLALETATALHEAGVTALTDKLMAEAAASRATAERVQAERAWRKARGRLALTLGLSPETELQLPDLADLNLRHDSVPTYDQLSDDMLDRHPAVTAAMAEVSAAEQRLRLVKAEARPALTLNGQYVRSPPPNSSVLSPDNVVSIGVQLSVPLFQGFEPHYRARAADAELESQRVALAAVRRQVRQELWAAYQDWTAARDNRLAVLALAGSVKQTLHVTEGRYREGVVGITDWLEAQRIQAETERLKVDAETDWHAARVRLAASMGQLGLWILQPSF
ncbi:MAG: TolC family protein [Thiobacillus sp.]|nr:TolC family protein [Thiobacillus sp.]